MDCADKSGENNAFFGRHHTDETKDKIRKIHLGKKLSAEHKEKCKAASNNFYSSQKGIEYRNQLSAKMTGENHPLYGVGHTEESILKMSNTKRENFKNMTIEERIDRVINSKKNMRMIFAENKYYFTAKEASVAFNISATAMQFRCKSTDEKWCNFRYVDNQFLKKNRKSIILLIKQRLEEKSLDAPDN
jgi:hypothetical protein